MSERKIPTPAQWVEIEKALQMPGGHVKLRVDGYALTLAVHHVKPLRYGIGVYIDGRFLWAWILKQEGEWCEEARRFLPLHRKHLYSAAVRQRFEKAFGKRRAAKDSIMTAMYEWRSMYWTSFRPLKRHLLANNHSIELIVEEAVTS